MITKDPNIKSKRERKACNSRNVVSDVHWHRSAHLMCGRSAFNKASDEGAPGAAVQV